jgi:hypothetical protein
VVQVFPPQRKAKGERIEGEADAVAARLAEVIEGMQLGSP